MEKLTRQEFNKRVNHVANARRIFFDTGLTRSLDLAFEMYLAVFDNLNLQAKINVSTPTKKPCPLCHFPALTYERGCCGGNRTRWLCTRCRYEEFV